MESDSFESISTWSLYQVAQFVKQLLGTDIYSKALKENNVNGKTLLNCKLEDWKQFGVHSLSHRAALYGWAQGRHNSYQERISTQRRISMESSNKARKKEAGKQNDIPDNKLLENIKTSKKIPAKALLKENYHSQSRICNDNIKDMREWFKDGAGQFSRQEFLTGNLKKNPEPKAAIIEVIERKKKDLTSVMIEKEPCIWSTQEIFAKVLTQRNYMKKIHMEAEARKFCEKTVNVLHSSPEVKDKSIQSQEFYVPSMEELDDGQTFMSAGMLAKHTPADTFLSVTMFGSPFYIPEQVIQFRQERLAAKGAAIEYKYFPEFDEGTIGFGASTLIHKQVGGSYEKWEILVIDLAIGIGMGTLLLPGTRRVASSVRVGERLILPAVYLLMAEYIPESETNHARENNCKSDTYLSDDHNDKLKKKEDGKILELLSKSEDKILGFQNDRDKEVLDNSRKTKNEWYTFQCNEDNEVGDDVHGKVNIVSTMELVDLTTCNKNDDDNVDDMNTLEMDNQCGRSNMLVNNLVQEYHSIDMESTLAIQATFRTQEAFKKKQDELADGKSQEVKEFSDFESVEVGSRKRMSTKRCKKSVKKKVLKDITNDSMKCSKGISTQNTQEPHVPVLKGRHERVVRAPLRYRD